MQRFANVLKGLGVEQGRPGRHLHADDPRAAGGACWPAPASAPPHSVVFGGFSRRLAVRPHQRRRVQGRSSPPTAAGAAAQPAPLKPNADVARRRHARSIEHVVVVPQRTGQRRRHGAEGRDHWYHDLMAEAAADCPPEPMDSEDLLYLLYTSGTTAKPKGIMHTTGGYLTQVAFTHKYVFDLHPETDVYWCAADIGWVTGHSYIVYGPLANGATAVMYEGTPDTPGQGPAVGHRRALRRHHPLHRAHRHPHVHEVGRRGAREARPVVAAAARLGGRAHQPRGVDVVPRAHRRRPLPDRRHVVADRDRRHHDLAAARAPPPPSPGSATFPLPGIGAEVVDEARQAGRARAAATSRSPGRGRRCCAASTATPSATATPTGAASRAATSPATAPRSTTTATSGCSAGSTT